MHKQDISVYICGCYDHTLSFKNLDNNTSEVRFHNKSLVRLEILSFIKSHLFNPFKYGVPTLHNVMSDQGPR